MTVNEHLRDLALRRAIHRLTPENLSVRVIRGLWAQTTYALVTRMRERFPAKRTDTPGFGLLLADRIPHFEDLLTEARALLNESILRIYARLEQDLTTFAQEELVSLPRALNTLVVSPPWTQERPDETPPIFHPMLAFAGDFLTSSVGGAFFDHTLDALVGETLRRVSSEIRAGLLLNQTPARVAASIRKIMRRQQTNLEQLVRGEFVRIGSQIDLLTYDRNKSLLDGVQWHATFDIKGCLQCGATLDGVIWEEVSKAKIPILSTHLNCRCIISAVLRGVPPAKTIHYKEWFSQQDEVFQSKVLGPARFHLYHTGQMTLDSFVGPRGIRRVRDIKSKIMEAS